MSAPSASPAHSPSIAFNLAAIALMVAVAGLALAYGIDALGRMRAVGPSIDGPTVSRVLAGVDLDIPESWLRSKNLERDAFAERVELRLMVPVGEAQPLARVDVTLVPRARVRPSASLLDRVYLLQFDNRQLAGPVGLIGKPLKPETGYQSESVWYDPLHPNPFVAKCQQPVAENAGATCLRTVVLGPHVAAIFAFDQSLLQDWARFDALLKPYLTRIGAI